MKKPQQLFGEITGVDLTVGAVVFGVCFGLLLAKMGWTSYYYPIL